MEMKISGDLLAQKGILLFGTADEVGEQILRLKEDIGYEDFFFTCWFELGGFASEEIEAQMQHFMEAVAPGLAHACGGQATNPDVSVGFLPEVAPRV
jgi:hypothetical protein